MERTPDWARQAGLAAFDRREPDVEVADLKLDSLMTRTELASGARVLRFAGSSRSVTVVVSQHEETVALALTIAPAAHVAVEVRPLHGAVQELWCTPEGQATCSAVLTGPLSLLVHWPPSMGGPMRTAWVLV